jgi:hypothetical protein
MKTKYKYVYWYPKRNYLLIRVRLGTAGYKQKVFSITPNCSYNKALKKCLEWRDGIDNINIRLNGHNRFLLTKPQKSKKNKLPAGIIKKGNALLVTLGYDEEGKLIQKYVPAQKDSALALIKAIKIRADLKLKCAKK